MISLMLCGNRRVFDGALIVTLSLLRHTDSPVALYLLTMDLHEQNPAFLPITPQQADFLEALCKKKNTQSSVTLLDVGAHYRETMLHSPNADTGYTPYTFLRLFSDRIPEIPDKILYVDTDVVFSASPEALFSTDLSGYELAGVPDYYGRFFFWHDYLNAGVLLLNLEEIRKTGLFCKTVALCAEKKLFLPDQTALNRLVKKKLLLPRSCNEQKKDRSGTIIRHFSKTILWFPYFHTRNIKPWEIEKIHEVLGLHRYDDLLGAYIAAKKQFEKKESSPL